MSANTIRPIYPLRSTPFDETSTAGRASQVSFTNGHYSSISEPSTNGEKEFIANETFNVPGKASTNEGSIEEVSSAIANACTLHELIVITKNFW